MAHRMYPEERLRVELSNLGIPRDKHALQTMQGMVPAHLDEMPLGCCDPDVLAEILIHLLSTNIVRLPCERGAALSLEWGSHICHFYRDPEELLELLVAYIREGLENNEYCVWILPGGLASEQALQAMRRGIPSLHLHGGRFELIAHDEWYLDAAGKMRGRDALLAGWAEKERRALAQGYAGLRLTGDKHWLDRKNRSGFIKYECDVNAAVGGSRMKALCTYPRRRCGEHEIMEVLHGHQTVLAKKNDWWYRITTSQNHAARAVLEAVEGEWK